MKQLVSEPATPLWAMALVLVCSVIASIGQGFFKVGSRTASLNPLELVRNWSLILGLALYGVATIIFIVTLKHGRLSSLYPVMALSYVWVFLISWGYFREFSDRSPLFNALGLALILAGVFLVMLGR